jgi:hypothetical protein
MDSMSTNNAGRPFLTEGEYASFDGWMKCQDLDPARMTPDSLATFRDLYDERLKRSKKIGLMKLKRPAVGEYRYAVAVREESDLLLVLWIRRTQNGCVFIIMPRPEPGSDAHASYHCDGTFHMKNFKHKTPSREKRRRLTDAFRGTETLGLYQGFTPREAGALCDPEAFSEVIEVPPGVLGPRNGAIVVDLVEPGAQPPPFIDSSRVPFPFQVGPMVREAVFRDKLPWIVVRVG